MSLGSLLQIGVIADSQVIEAGGEPQVGLTFDLPCSVDFDTLFALGASTAGQADVTDMSISAQNASWRFGDEPRIRYPAASNWPGTRGINEGALRAVVNPDIVNLRQRIVDVATFYASNDNPGSALVADRFIISVGTTGQLGVFVWNSTGSQILIESPFGLVLSASTVQEVEVNWKLGPNACIWAYVDGVLGSTIINASIVQGAAASNIIFGFSAGRDSDKWQGLMKNFKIFDTVQHTASSYNPDF